MRQSDDQSWQSRSLLDRIADWLLILSLLVIGAFVGYYGWIFYMFWAHGAD